MPYDGRPWQFYRVRQAGNVERTALVNAHANCHGDQDDFGISVSISECLIDVKHEPGQYDPLALLARSVAHRTALKTSRHNNAQHGYKIHIRGGFDGSRIVKIVIFALTM